MDDRLKGTVKWFNPEKGYGFIESDGKEYFVHFKEIKVDGYKTLSQGATVYFKGLQQEKGWKALGVEVQK